MSLGGVAFVLQLHHPVPPWQGELGCGSFEPERKSTTECISTIRMEADGRIQPAKSISMTPHIKELSSQHTSGAHIASES